MKQAVVPGDDEAERRYPRKHQPAQERQMIIGKFAFQEAYGHRRTRHFARLTFSIVTWARSLSRLVLSCAAARPRGIRGKDQRLSSRDVVLVPRSARKNHRHDSA